ncbi:Histone lysine acetyltransferase CREBBP [Taenia crassiceps]|uniref:histone acetyltransferase n=1 Tax=Taenia crassiceps TaxID=6207 RepID=A0ABR4QRW1_9CEST
MRQLLSHICTCDRGSDCTFRHCSTCKQLKNHSDHCDDPRCVVCPSRFPPDGSGTGRYSLNDCNSVMSHDQPFFVNGGHSQLYHSSSTPSVSEMRQMTTSTGPLTNGFDWRLEYDAAKREEIVRSHAGQVFPPPTYNDCRSEAVFTLFKDQEMKMFKESLTEQDYLSSLQRFVVRLQNELKHKSRINPISLANGTSSSPAHSKEDILTEQKNPRSQPSALCDSNAKVLESAFEASNGLPQDYNDSNSNLCKQPITEPLTPSCASGSSVLKKDEPLEIPIKPEPSSIPDTGRRCAWTKEQLKEAFIPLVINISNQEPHSVHFRTPVPFEELKLSDYPSIVPFPMDLSTIEKKLKGGEYLDPWDVVDDFWLMFNNAWRYNRKNSKIYKACSRLSEIFEGIVDPLMQKLGFCCGHAYVHHPHVLTCLTDKSCNINRDDVYYVYETKEKDQKKELLDKYIVCEKCYQSAGSTITIDDQSSPVKLYGICRSPNRFTAKRLPTCKLSDFLEKRVNDFMKKNESQTNEVIIRVLASANKTVEVKKYMREIFSDSGKFPESFPYRAKVIFAFQELDGQEVCFFGLYVQEYSSDCPAPNKRRVYIAYLDSVYFFQPKQYRTDVYHEILIGYLHYAKKQGFANAHIWACPPGEGDDYIFHMHPPDQKIPKPKRLQDWYRKMLQKAHNERIVVDYNNIYQDAVDTNCLSPVDVPYFDGDLWPNTLEELLKPAVENRRKFREEEELLRSEVDDYADGVDDEGDSNQGSFDSDRKPGSAGSGSVCMNGIENKKKTKKRKMKRAASSLSIHGGSKRKRLSAAAASGDTEAEVQRRLEEMLQRHSEAFLTINLHSRSQIASLQPIKDPDPLFASELMECRDTFLSRARERHLEFSSLRRAKFSTLSFLYDIHTENKDAFIYSCNSCQKELEAPRQCKQCPNYFLCEDCFKAYGHRHPMEKIVLSDDNGSTAAVQQSDRLKMERCVELLKHTSSCRDANCRNQACRDMKRRLGHFMTQHDRSKCFWCRQIHRILSAHSTKCNDPNCQVMYCAHYKAVKKQQESQQRLRKLQTLRRRQKTMQCSHNIKTPQQPNTPQSIAITNSSSGAAQPLVASTASPTVFNAPSSSEPPHSFSSQTSLTSPHSASNSRYSPSKPTSVPAHPPALQYSHSSPYQHAPHTSPISVIATKSLSSHQTPHLPSPADYPQVASVASPYAQQPPIYQQQPQVVQQHQMHPSQTQQTRSYSSEAGFVRQSNSTTSNFYENGQSSYIRNPMVAVSPRLPYQMPAPDNEDVYSLPVAGIKRPFFGECDVISAGAVGASVYAVGGGGQSLKQSRLMMSHPQQPSLQNPAPEQQQQPMMHWTSNVAVTNGQIIQPGTMAGGKMAQMGPLRPQQPLPNQSTTPSSHLGNVTTQLPSSTEVEMVLSARRSIANEMEFNSWLHQQPHLVPAWNYIRSQQKVMAPTKSFQYSTQQSMPQQLMRGSVGFLSTSQPQRIVQQSQNAMPSSWPMQQPQTPQDLWGVRQPCYVPQGKFPCGQNLQQQQHPVMTTNPYPTSAFPPRYPSPISSSTSPGGMLRAPVAQQRMPAPPPISPRPPPPPYGPQQQQPPPMLSQLLVQPHSQLQQHQQLLQRPPQDGTSQSQPPPPPQQHQISR